MRPQHPYLRLLISLLVIASQHVFAQTTTIIDGYVKGTDGKASDAYVTVSPKGKSVILGFADVDVTNGYYKVEFAIDTDSVIVTAAGMTIGKNVRTVPNRTQRIDFVTVEQVMQIKEVTVKAPKIRKSGDTISYNVATYAKQDDRVIGDVIKRMPGMEVSENGRITYNGKDISKFYIEDMDMLQSRYGLATKNVNAKDVTTVQVMENHQAIKSLRGKELTDDVAVNLKLRPNAKGTFAVNTMLGSGFQEKSVVGDNLLWTGEAVSMYFGKRRQNMVVYNGDNTGNDASSQLKEQYAIRSVRLYPFCPMGVVMPPTAGVSQKRYLDNHSHVLSVNHLEKLGNDTELTFYAGYHTDYVRRAGYSASDRFLSEEKHLLTEETLTSQTHVNNLMAQARYCKNASDKFFVNILDFKGAWNDDKVDGLLTSNALAHPQQVTQHLSRPQLSVKNTINTIRSIGDNRFNLFFSVGYAQRPNSLEVGIDSMRYTQDITSRHYAANFNTGYSISLGHFTSNYGLTANGGMQSIGTDLMGYEVNDSEELINDVRYGLYEVSLGQSYKYKNNGLQVILGLPLNLQVQQLEDCIRGTDYSYSYSHLLLSPSLSVQYEVRDFTFTANSHYQRNVGNPNAIYGGYIMSNYRTFQRNFVKDLCETQRISGSANIAYSNALSATFGNLGAGYTRTQGNTIYGHRYDGIISVIEGVSRPTTTENYHIKGGISQGFDWWQSTLGLSGRYTYSKNEQLIDGTIYPFNHKFLVGGMTASVTPIRWLNLVYSSQYSKSNSHAPNSKSMARDIVSSINRMTLNLYIAKPLTLSASVDDFYNDFSASERNHHTWFADIKAKYRMKRVDLELEANNLFNEQAYTLVTYDNLDVYRNVCYLRPINVVTKVRFKLL